MATRVNVNSAALNRILRSPNGPVGNRLFTAGIRVSNNAKRNAPVDTGRLRASIQVTRPEVRGNILTVRVGSNVNYAIFVEEGTQFMRGRHYLRNALGV